MQTGRKTRQHNSSRSQPPISSRSWNSRHSSRNSNRPNRSRSPRRAAAAARVAARMAPEAVEAAVANGRDSSEKDSRQPMPSRSWPSRPSRSRLSSSRRPSKDRLLCPRRSSQRPHLPLLLSPLRGLNSRGLILALRIVLVSLLITPMLDFGTSRPLLSRTLLRPLLNQLPPLLLLLPLLSQRPRNRRMLKQGKL